MVKMGENLNREKSAFLINFTAFESTIFVEKFGAHANAFLGPMSERR